MPEGNPLLGRFHMRRREVQPTGMQLPAEAQLVVRTWAFPSGQEGDARLEVMTASGRIVPMSFHFLHSGNRGWSETRFDLQECFLLGARLTTVAGAARRHGALYAVLLIAYGRASTSLETRVLCSGWLTEGGYVGWPGGGAQDPTATQGQVFRHQILAAGGNETLSVEVGDAGAAPVTWRLHSMWLQLATDATVGNRQVQVIVRDGTAELFRAGGNVNQPASTTYVYVACASGVLGQVGSAPSLVHHLPLPVGMLLRSGWFIETSAQGLQAGDTYSNAQLLLEEWPA